MVTTVGALTATTCLGTIVTVTAAGAICLGAITTVMATMAGATCLGATTATTAGASTVITCLGTITATTTVGAGVATTATQ